MEKQKDREKMLNPNEKDEFRQFTPGWNSTSKEKSKTLRQVVFQCLKEGDYVTLDNLLLNRSTKDIEKFWTKEASSLLKIAMISYPPASLNYLATHIPLHIISDSFSKDNFLFLRSYITSYTCDKENGTCGEKREQETIEKLHILSNIEDVELKNCLKNICPSSSRLEGNMFI